MQRRRFIHALLASGFALANTNTTASAGPKGTITDKDGQDASISQESNLISIMSSVASIQYGNLLMTVVSRNPARGGKMIASAYSQNDAMRLNVA